MKVITSSLPVLQRRNGSTSLPCDTSGRGAKTPSFGQPVRQRKDLFPCQHWWGLERPIQVLFRLIQSALVTAIPELLPEAGIGEAGMRRLEFANLPALLTNGGYPAVRPTLRLHLPLDNVLHEPNEVALHRTVVGAQQGFNQLL